ncbi:MAG: diguanylate cyclase, partial [Oscillospiraceae bacterium]|nr:diguanylate cyclase [Oscillospiraceae bacterium]
INDIPVIMITSETRAELIEKAYQLGVTDVVNRPFNAQIVHHRVVNTILLSTKQKRLVGMVRHQVYEKEQQSELMIDILSHIVEFRNGESGLHVLHIRVLTELLLRRLVQKTSRYHLSSADIRRISMASALHDIGKVAIPEQILNKPGRLTNDEFETIKLHPLKGAQLLKDLSFHQDKPLLKTAYEICLWHHERYDGRGYPHRLKGDDIPISAQVTALADVYDALTGERVYKHAIPHEEALRMIVNGECGVFNPILLECLLDTADNLHSDLRRETQKHLDKQQFQRISSELLQMGDLSAAERTLYLLDYERMKYQFFAAIDEGALFEYNTENGILTTLGESASRFGVPEVTFDPLRDPHFIELFGATEFRNFEAVLRSVTPENPIFRYECGLNVRGKTRWTRLVCQVIFSEDEVPQYRGLIGKAMDIHEERSKVLTLEYRAAHDALTSLLNADYGRSQIQSILDSDPDGKYILSVIDLDHFKNLNDSRGHLFGNQVLCFVAEQLRQSVNTGDVIARFGGDEIILFQRYEVEAEPVVKRVFSNLTTTYDDYSVSVSMGVATTEMVDRNYSALFHAADQALYAVKQEGRGKYRLYDRSITSIH